MAKEQWGTRIGVILAVAGSAVGLGNFLRFPGQAAANGGGTFLIPYFISLLILGIPLCWAEWTMGRYAGTKGCNSAPSIFRAIWPSRWASYLGAPALMIPLVIYMYYVLIEAWCLGYAINYLTGDLVTGTGGVVDELVASAPQRLAQDLIDNEGLSEAAAQAQAAKMSEPDKISSAYNAFFGNFVGAGEDGALLKQDNLPWLGVLIGTFAFNFFLIYRGVTKGIETFCRIAMPCMIVLALIVLVRVLTLGTPDPNFPDQSVIGGLGFMWNPQWEKLFVGETWLAASGQIFFSLSVGFGIIVNYASYLRRDDDVVLSGLTASSMNEFFEVCLGGLITLPAAFIFLGVAAGGQGTFDLGFKALPNVFSHMYGGQLFGFLWFFMLFIAAMTSSVSMLQPVIAFLEEGFGLKRHASAALLGLLTALGCMFVMFFSKGLIGLDTFDFWIGTLMIFVLALFQAILYGWIFGIKRGEEEAHRGAHIRIPRFVQYLLKYVVPVYLLTIFAAFCYQQVPSGDEPLFETDIQLAMSLDSHNMPSHLEGSLQEEQEKALAQAKKDPEIQKLEETRREAKLEAVASKYELPKDPEVTGKDGHWRIKDANGKTHFTLHVFDQRIVVNRHTTGRAEQILNRPAAMYSIMFLGVLLLFMLGMITIASRRWEASNKFTEPVETNE